jgi:CRP/FNR family cyclic AMP-dependent transcriptional regulator
LHLIREMPDFAIGFINLLVQKLRWTTSFAETIAQYNTPGRLLFILLHFKDRLGKEIIKNKLYEIDLHMNQTDLASLVGARREWVNRILKDWRQKGLIKHEKGIITILDLPAVVTELERSKDIFTIDGIKEEWIEPLNSG